MYTEELTATIIARYLENPTRQTVHAIAEDIGKSPSSVTAKLCIAKVYKSPVRATKTGDPIVKKDEMVEDIGKWIGTEVPTIVKSGKQDLIKLHAYLKDLHNA